MKTQFLNLTKCLYRGRLIPALLITLLSFSATSPVSADGHGRKDCDEIRIYPPDSRPFGKSYGEWAAKFWQWAFALQVEGHPFLPNASDPYFDFSYEQSGKVWFWSAPDGPTNRVVTMPANKALFLTIRDVDCSSLEAPDSGFYGETEVEQRECAKFWADHIVDVFCVVDGEPVENLEAYRVSTPQFKFKAPTPWIFGEVGGKGTAVGDGYFLMFAPLPKGEHTIHYGGTFRFTLADDGFDGEFPKDITIHLTVE